MSNQTNVRQMLLALDTPSFLADMAIPFMFLMPATTDPDSPSVIEINRALQRGLRKLGYARVDVNGVLDAQTASALRDVSLPRGSWTEKTYLQLAGDVLRAKADPTRAAHKMMTTPSKGLGGYFNYSGEPPGPLPSWRAGTPPGPLGMGSTFIDSGTSLTFGQGLSNKSNVVPIPKTSGPTYNAFKNLQRQINRLIWKKGKKIDEDGILGSGTYSAYKEALSTIPAGVAPSVSSVVDLASRAVSAAYGLRNAADYMGISVTANPGKTTSKASVKEPTPPPMTPQQAASYPPGDGGITDALKKYFPFLLVAGGVAWYAKNQKKGKR